jgi:putative pyruvate formate lyase activating enzyme
LKILDGIVDIYMPDMKYGDEKIAEELSGIKDYPAVNRTALKEMHRQVGDLRFDEDGTAGHGLLIRHLVLPNRLAGIEGIMKFIADEISPDSYVNVMSQYRPCYRAYSFNQINRPLSRQEFVEAMSIARSAGLYHLDGMSDCFQNDLIRAVK